MYLEILAPESVCLMCDGAPLPSCELKGCGETNVVEVPLAWEDGAAAVVRAQ
jgi:hypothetical protein